MMVCQLFNGLFYTNYAYYLSPNQITKPAFLLDMSIFQHPNVPGATRPRGLKARSPKLTRQSNLFDPTKDTGHVSPFS